MADQKRKILFIHYGSGVGGAPVSMLHAASALEKKGFCCRIVFTQPGPILEYARKLGVSARIVRLRSTFSYGGHVPVRVRMLFVFLTHFRQTVRRAERLAYDEKPDLVHLNTSVLIPAAIGFKRARVPIVWHVREALGPNQLIRQWQTGKITQLAGRIIVTSDYVKRLFPQSDKIEVIHNAVDISSFEVNKNMVRTHIRDELGISKDAPVVSMIGSVQAVKGHYLLVESAKEVVRKNPDIRFMIIAGGVNPNYKYTWKGRVKRMLGKPMDNLDRMRRLISHAGLEQNFIFTGYRQDIPELLAVSDIIAFLSQEAEGFGRPLIEAMAAGLPVVATDVGPTKEILGVGTSILVPTGSSKSAAKAIIELLGSMDRQKQLGLKGRKRADQYFGMDQYVSKICEIYDSVFAKPDGR